MRRLVGDLFARAVVLCVLACVPLFGVTFASSPARASAEPWTSAGAGAADDRYQLLESRISPLNVGRLKPKWIFTTHGSESATPVVYKGVVYFPDFGGYINAVNASTGALIWQQPVSSYDGVAGSYSRDSAVIYGNELIFGDVVGGVHPAGAHVIAVNASTGALLWSTQVDSHPAAIITGSPVVAGGKVLVGVSSNEETDAANTAYPCCTFRGSVVALNPANGQIEWQTYTVAPNSGLPCTSDNPPAGCGYSGGAVWDSPAVDLATKTVFIGTGNNYTAPDTAVACAQTALENHTSDAGCTAPDDFFDSLLALNLNTGAVQWSYKAEGWDTYTLACIGKTAGTNWCPDPEGNDWDFGSGPNLMVIPAAGGGSETVVGAGQKSGIYWELNAATGQELWSQQVGPGGSLGGVVWGTAYDGTRIYVHESNSSGQPYTFADGETVAGGSWGALNPVTGQWEWQTATPLSWAAMGPTTVADGVVYAGSMAPSGNNMYAMSAATGKILWQYPSGGSVNSGPAIVDGTVYWGSGYSELAALGYSGNNKLYAFSIGGR
jgi:polyvinyl alcohol dehydrogenase (cytochrome)